MHGIRRRINADTDDGGTRPGSVDSMSDIQDKGDREFLKGTTDTKG